MKEYMEKEFTPEIYFYILADPFTGEVCYVGQTTDPERRQKQHFQRPGMFKGNAWMTIWINHLSSLGTTPIFEIVEITNDFKIWMRPWKREAEIIEQYYNKGCPLLNRRPRLRNQMHRLESSFFWKRVLAG